MAGRWHSNAMPSRALDATFYDASAIREAAARHGVRVASDGDGRTASTILEGPTDAALDAVAADAIRIALVAHPPSAPEDVGFRIDGGGGATALLAPFRVGVPLGGGFLLRELNADTTGELCLEFEHEGRSLQVRVRPRDGTTNAIASTRELDFILLNAGDGSRATPEAFGRLLRAMAARIDQTPRTPDAIRSLASFVGDGRAEGDQVRVETDTRGLPRLRAAVLPMLRTNGVSAEAVPGGFVLRAAAPSARLSPRLAEHLRAVLASDEPTLPSVRAARDSLPATASLPLVPPRAPDHGTQRVLHLRGTGACDSDCLFCVEKFDPTHRPSAGRDQTTELLIRAAGAFDVLFFASGEPTLNPRLFDRVRLARRLGFRSFGMSSHFRRLRDPSFTASLLEAGFRHFDLSLHAASPTAQLAVNPIGDEGRSLDEALRGLEVLVTLASQADVPIALTHKLVVSRLNADTLEDVVTATYTRGVRRFLVQPVRLDGLTDERVQRLALDEASAVARVNQLALHLASLGDATLKPYGFGRADLVTAPSLEFERNLTKNTYGAARGRGTPALPTTTETRPGDGRPWVEVTHDGESRFGFGCDVQTPILDAALARGAELAHGCRMGACGMCAAHLVSGEVDQPGARFLSAEQKASGLVLLCQARPRGDVLVRTCREDEIDAL